MRALSLVATAAALLGALPATAQTPLTGVTVTGNFTGIDVSSRRFNLDSLDRTDPYLQLEWRAVVSDFTTSYEFELSYDQTPVNNDNVDDPSSIRVKLEEVPNVGRTSGSVRSGELNVVRIRPIDIVCVASSTTANPCTEGNGVNNPKGENINRRIRLTIFPAGRAGENMVPALSQDWEFYFDTRRPTAPSITRLDSGDGRLGITFATPDPSDDNASFEVVWWTKTASTPTDAAGLASITPTGRKRGISATQTRASIDGLVNEREYVVAMQTVDPLNNLSVIGAPAVGSPTNVRDYFEYYREQGGTEEGGFCFVATAAYGDYDAPAVRLLRAFRDGVLARLPLGDQLIAAYYRWSPPLARAIADDAELRAEARAVLAPVVLLVALVMLAPLVALTRVVLTRAGGQRRGRAASTAALTAAVLGLGVAGPAEADSTRAKPTGLFGVGLELRGGPYLPRMATEGGPAGDTFERIFGTPSGGAYRVDPNPLFRVGGDLQLLRGVGTLGIGASFGFMQFVGRGLFVDGTRSTDTSVLNVMPLELTAFYRFDLLEDRVGIPLVPYVRGGLAYHVWWVTNGTGEIARAAGAAGEDVARGGKLGLTASLGAALLLNVLEPNTARSLYESTGFRGTYLFGQLDILEVDGFGGDGFDLSDLTWSVGLSFER